MVGMPWVSGKNLNDYCKAISTPSTLLCCSSLLRFSLSCTLASCGFLLLTEENAQAKS